MDFSLGKRVNMGQLRRDRPTSSAFYPVLSGLMSAMLAGNVFAIGNDNVMLNANAGVTYDSNIFRVSDQQPASVLLGPGREKSDYIYRVGAGVNANIPYGRQHFEGSVDVTNYTYQNNSALDYVGGNARGAWDWRVGNDWNGQLAYTWGRSLQSFDSVTGFLEKNLITRQNLSLDGNYRLDSRWELQGGTSYYISDNSATEQQPNNYREWRVRGGARYTTPSGNSIGFRLRSGEARFPDRFLDSSSTSDNAYRETRLSTFFNWRVTGNSKIDGNIGYARRDHNNLPQRDFQGWTGNIGWLWTISAKTSLRADLVRELGGIEDAAATYARTYTASIRPSYQLTEKIQLSATASYKDQEYFGNTGFVSGFDPGRHDQTRSLYGSVRYEPTRLTSLSLSLGHTSRSSNVNLGDYSQYFVSVTGGIRF